jgi:hypothetical protein
MASHLLSLLGVAPGPGLGDPKMNPRGTEHRSRGSACAGGWLTASSPYGRGRPGQPAGSVEMAGRHVDPTRRPGLIVQREQAKPVKLRSQFPGRTAMTGPIIAMLDPGIARSDQIRMTWSGGSQESKFGAPCGIKSPPNYHPNCNRRRLLNCNPISVIQLFSLKRLTATQNGPF